MIDKQRLLVLAFAATMGLALGQAIAETPTPNQEPAASPVPAAAPAEPATPATSADAMRAQTMRAQMEQRHAEAMAERDKRYADLRQRAAEVGLELPETPPWAQNGMPDMPKPPAMRDDMATGAAQMPPSQMRPRMTPEERQAKREERWEEMRARAAERGVELPETPPWEAAEQRRKEMLERYNKYRAIIEAMTDEQKEAISALFNNTRRPMPPQAMPRHGHRQGYGPMGRGMEPDMMMPRPTRMPEPPAAHTAPDMAPAPEPAPEPAS